MQGKKAGGEGQGRTILKMSGQTRTFWEGDIWADTKDVRDMWRKIITESISESLDLKTGD